MKGTRNMTKKEYLKSLGYDYDVTTNTCAKYINVKDPEYISTITVKIDLYFNDFYVRTALINRQKEIDDLQIAFNNVKRDFEEVQKYED